MGIVSESISEGKEGKQIAHFEISDPNRPIISLRAMPLHKQSSVFVQVRPCCLRELGLSWNGTFHRVIMQPFRWPGLHFFFTSQTPKQKIAKRWRHKPSPLVPPSKSIHWRSTAEALGSTRSRESNEMEDYL